MLLLALGRPVDARAELLAASVERPTAQFAAYDAVALSRMGMREEAIGRIAESTVLYGETELLVAVRSLVGDAHAERSKGAAQVVTTDAGVELLQLLDRADVAILNWDRSHAKVHSRLVSSVTAACGSLMALTAATLARAELNENGYSTVLREILGHQIDKYGWSVPDQSLGGTTAAGNPGERDLVVRNGTVELTVVEAVICRGRAELQRNRRELVGHFKKLFSYGMCRIFFHLTYCFESVVVDTLAVLKDIARESVFGGLLFDSLEEMHSFDSSPDGFVAHYSLDKTRVTVVFLALNLGQETQRLAAVEAAKGRSASRIAS
jgi:hypothetical protein